MIDAPPLSLRSVVSDQFPPRKISVDYAVPIETQQSVGTATTNETGMPTEFMAEIVDRLQATDAFEVTAVTGRLPVERVNLGGITSPTQFWNQIVIPNRADFLNRRTARTAFNLAQCLWAVTEWVWYNWPGPGQPPTKKEDYVEDHIRRCVNLAYVQDIAEAAKHCHLRRATVQTASINEETLEITLKGGVKLQMDDVLESVFAYWPKELKFH
jgi:hypothetical protein